MRRLLPALLGLGCLGGLTAACFGSVLFRGEQFAFRDAGHFYYPLYLRVQQEWDAGRWPLWAPEENGGMPLLGNPTAAVLYPGKLLFARPIPFPWGMRLYIIGHVLLAVAGMYALARSWGIGRSGSGVAALAYGFGMPVLFQYCNVVFLVGAAWMPLGFRAADRWLRLGRRWGLIELAPVLAMQTLGGDPQAAYLTALCAGGYALGLARADRPPGRPRRRGFALALLAAFAVGAVLLARRIHRPRSLVKLAPALAAAMPAVRWAVLAAWAALGLVILVRGRRAGSALPGKLTGLAVAAGVALALAAVQLVPTLEFTALSLRAAEGGPHDIYPFSLEPYRLLELAWPSAFGAQFLGENHAWLGLLPPAGQHDIWIPSLYLGGLTLVLALGAAGFRGGPPWRAWMTAVAVLALLASFGQYAGPLWWARWLPGGAQALGPHDSFPPRAVRLDGLPRDGDFGPYWLLATAVPGFGSFRYPAKLLVLASLALAALAGLGWDRALAGRGRRSLAWAVAGLVLSAAALVAWEARGARLLADLQASLGGPDQSIFGPFRPREAFRDTRRGMVHGAVVLGSGAALLGLARRRPRWAAALAPALLAADLAAANARFVLTMPQALFDTTPEAVRRLREAEAAREHPKEGLDPFRVHRMPIWNPAGWFSRGSPDRLREMIAWERKTIQPKYALPYGISYTLTEGTTELYDYWWFFAPFDPKIDREAALTFGGPVGRKIVYHPRRGFDLWNTRYFLVPSYPGRWDNEHRSYASFLPDSTVLYPPPETFRGPGGREALRGWIEDHDWQLLRNDRAYPRAWVVHAARFLPPIAGLAKQDRQARMMEILYEENPIWHEPGRTPIDPREKAWIETDDPARLAPFVPGGRPDPRDEVIVRRYEPQLVELEARLTRPGLVLLADVHFPGWRLAIDGRPAPILRANRLMRGAAVEAGTHRLVYTYEPLSFRLGGLGTALGLLATLGLAAWAARGPARSP